MTGDEPGMKAFNKVLKDNTSCNKEGFCSVVLFADLKYIPKNQNEVNIKELGRFINTHQNTKLDIYSKNKEHLDPVDVWVFLGTNGFLMNGDWVKNYLINTLKKDKK